MFQTGLYYYLCMTKLSLKCPKTEARGIAPISHSLLQCGLATPSGKSQVYFPSPELGKVLMTHL